MSYSAKYEMDDIEPIKGMRMTQYVNSLLHEYKIYKPLKTVN